MYEVPAFDEYLQLCVLWYCNVYKNIGWNYIKSGKLYVLFLICTSNH